MAQVYRIISPYGIRLMEIPCPTYSNNIKYINTDKYINYDKLILERELTEEEQEQWRKQK